MIYRIHFNKLEGTRGGGGGGYNQMYFLFAGTWAYNCESV